MSEDEAVEVFVEQIEGLREGGADVVWIETMSAAEEMRAAARGGGARCGMPYTVTASFDTAGRTMMGVAPAAFGDLVEGFDPAPLAYRRELRRRRLRPPGRDPRHERATARR